MSKKEYPRPAYAADILLFATEDVQVESQLPCWQTFILLIVRKNEPFKNCWALPGGYVNEGETSIQAARREAEEEIGIALSEQYGIPQFVRISDAPNRDPRGWVISASYLWHLKERINAKAGDDAKEAEWFNVDDLPKNIAFDHIDIINMALKTLHN